MVMSGPDPHMIRIWTVEQQVMFLQMEVATSVYDDDIIMFFMIINGWDLSLILVIMLY